MLNRKSVMKALLWLSLSTLVVTEELDSSTNFGDCKTPKQENGECVYLENCENLYALLQSRDIGEEDKAFLRKSHCGNRGNKILVCCQKKVESAKIEIDDIANDVECETPKQEQGLCKPIENCQSLHNLLLSNNLSQEEKMVLSQSQCEYRNGKYSVCCPKKKEANALQGVINGSTLLPRPGACGNALSSRIYGGKTTNIDEFPWMAMIEYTKEEGKTGLHCGGSLINNRYVVTASHCVNGFGIPKSWKITRVRLGEWDTSTNPDCQTDDVKDCAPPHIDVPIEKIIPHPQYRPGSDDQHNDIALLRLSQNINFTDFIQPICLPLEANLRNFDVNGFMMDVSGWGRTETLAASKVKLKAAVAGTTLEKCRSVYEPRIKNISNLQICAGGNEGIDSCRGDSGGPLVGLDTSSKIRVYYFLVGVVSFGPQPCGLIGWPGVYTNVSAFIDWIQETIEP